MTHIHMGLVQDIGNATQCIYIGHGHQKSYVFMYGKETEVVVICIGQCYIIPMGLLHDIGNARRSIYIGHVHQ